MSGASSIIQDSHAYGDVFGTSLDVGGLVGLLTGDATVYRSSAHGDVSKTAGEYLGGLVGRIVNGGTIRECFATGDVLRPTGVSVQAGGLLGGSEGSSGTTLIEDCYSTGNNPSTFYYSPGRNGGLVGNFGRGASPSPHVINRCYSKGDVASTGGGGFMGIDSSGSRSGIISNSYASGGTIANSSAGFGVFAAQYTIVNCYWTNSATSDSYGGVTKVSNEAYFYNFANAPLDTWDFVNVWGFNGASDPCLQWQSAGCLPAVLPDVGTVVIIR